MTENRTRDAGDGLLIFRNGAWVETPVEEAPDAVRFRDIRGYYANVIGYARVVMGLLAFFTLGADQPALTAALIIGSTLLDWVDGPVARAHGQSSIFGAGIDWLADIQAQVVTVVWWGLLDPKVLPWLLIATTIELATCIFDFATTATGRYPRPGRQGGFRVILQWSMPGGSYTPFGTFLWLAYPLFAVSWCLDLSWPVQSAFTAQILRACHHLLFVPTILYVWCELAYFVLLLNHWTEPPHRAKPSGPTPIYDDGPAGVQLLGTIPEPRQDLLRFTCDAAIRRMAGEWEASAERKEIFWVNLWQRTEGGECLEVERIGELDDWVRGMTSDHYEGEEAELDGYGFIVNPVGSRTQPWHVDYTLDYSTLFIPLSPLTPGNGMQHLVLPPSLAADAYARAIADLDRVDIDDLLHHSDYVSVRQLLARPFSIIKLDFGAIHRGISNTESFPRIVFFISVKKRGAPVPPESLVVTI